jgi:serine/threonine protein kinase/tetratricopeptide (TPR) repeat protein
MTPERWKQIDELAQSALERGVDQRAGFLDEGCAGDEALRREVESQIAYQLHASKFLEEPAFKHAAELMADSQTETESMEGRTISHYSILHKLGAGGMGDVYLAQDTTLNRKVAIKFLSQNSIAGEQARKRLVREAKAAAALDHPHICAVHEVSEEAGLSFIVMQYVEGETLASRIRRQPVEVREALDIAVQIADALAEAHTHRIIHRDVKPENVMLTASGQVKVLDFGLARIFREGSLIDSIEETESSLTMPGSVIGTVPYMSPEQVRGEALDARSDIFSFGAVLYEMVSGRNPFAAESVGATMSSILTKEPAPLARYASDVPDELQRIVRKALSKDKGGRYQGIKDLLIDLRSLKHELEFEGELERSKSPDKSVTSEKPAVTDANQPADTGEVLTLRRASTGAYLVSGINRHRRAVIITLATLVVTIATLAYLFYFSPSSKAIDSIAVLPLVNTSNDPNTEYLSDGISEALINSLTELRQLRVMARATAFRYKGTEVDPQAVGRDLNVRAVLMGRVRQMGDTLNIQVDLVDATTGAQLWGQEYERKVSDVLSVKQAITREVTEKLRLRLSGEEQGRLVKRDTTNAEAYQAYLRGRYYWNKRTADGLRKAIEQFQQAIDRDPNYALGHVGLADSYLLLEEYAGAPASETLPKARAALDRALQIDDSLAEAHTSSAKIYEDQWRWAEAEEEYKRAISLNPNYPTAHHWFSVSFRLKRQFDDAMIEIKRAQELDPLSPVISVNVAIVYLLKNDLNSAIEQCKRIIELDPGFPGAPDKLGWAYLKQRRYEEATAAFQKAVELSGRASIYVSSLGYCYAVKGRRAEALRILKELEEKYARREAIGQDLASVYAALGEKDQAFAWLERDFEQRSGELPFITRWFSSENLRADPRYADLVRRMGLNP